MSQYIFIVANNILRPLEVGVETKDNMIIIEDENRLLSIYDDEQNCYTNPYTNLPVIRSVQIGMDFSAVEKDLFGYIKDAML